jgi:hypothetical protein
VSFGCDTKSSLLLSCSLWSDMTCGAARSILPGRASHEVRSSRDNVTSSCTDGGQSREAKAATPSIQGGWEPGLCGMVNSGEALLNVVIKAKRKMLNRLDQKVRGQVRRLKAPPAQPTHHRRRGAT